MKQLRIILINLFRAAVALTFIFSGFVKAVDPRGTQYKIEDYLEALGLGGVLPDWATLLSSVALSGLEFCLGVLLLFAIHRKVTSVLTTAFMAVMTAVTLWIWIADPISDCGCFGDAIHLTNGQTFAKDVALLLMVGAIARWPRDMVRFISKSNVWLVVNYSVVFVIILSSYSLYFLPPFDFRPYRVGVNIPEAMAMPPGAERPEFVSTFILRKDGQEREFTLEDYPDSTWEYVDTRTVKVKEGYEPPIHDFSIQDLDGDDLTEAILADTAYTFLLIAPHLETADDSYFGAIDQIHEYALDNDYPFYCLTASGDDAIDQWRNSTGATYRFCHTDDVTLRTIIRSNPGLLLLRKGTILQKWSHNDLPNKLLVGPLDELPQSQPSVPNQPLLILKMLLLWIVPLTVLSILDRLWVGGLWYWQRRKAAKASGEDEEGGEEVGEVDAPAAAKEETIQQTDIQQSNNKPEEL